MTPELEIRRGEEAQRVLTSDVYREAFALVEERLLSQLAVFEIDKDRAEYLRQLLVSNRKVRSILEQIMVTGRMAEEQKSLMERIRDKVPKVF